MAENVQNKTGIPIYSRRIKYSFLFFFRSGPTPEELEEMRRLEEEARVKREAEEKADKERREAEELQERRRRQEEWVRLNRKTEAWIYHFKRLFTINVAMKLMRKALSISIMIYLQHTAIKDRLNQHFTMTSMTEIHSLFCLYLQPRMNIIFYEHGVLKRYFSCEAGTVSVT